MPAKRLRRVMYRFTTYLDAPEASEVLQTEIVAPGSGGERKVAWLGLGQVLVGIHRCSRHPNFVMHMRARCAAGRAGQCDYLTSPNLLAWNHEKRGEVGVVRLQTIAVVDNHQLPVRSGPARGDHNSIGTNMNGCARRRRQDRFPCGKHPRPKMGRSARQTNFVESPRSARYLEMTALV